MTKVLTINRTILKEEFVMKKCLAVFLSLGLVFALLFTGCSSTGSTSGQTGGHLSSGEAPSAAEPEQEASVPEGKEIEECTIRFDYWRWSDPAQNAVLAGIVENFMKEYPQITVEAGGTSASQIVEQFTVQSLSGDAPDVVVVPFQRMSQFAEMGFVISLEDYVKSEPGFLDQYYDTIIPLMTFEGEIYGISHDIASSALYWNKSLFKEAGIDGPPASYEEFIEDAKKLTKPDIGQYGFALSGWSEASNQSRWSSLFWANGASIIDKEDEKTVLLDTPDGLETFARIIELHTKHGITVPDPSTLDYTTSVEMFSNNKIGMMQQNIGAAIAIQTQNPEVEFGIAPLKWDGYGMTSEGATAFISSSSKHPDAAWEFIKYLTNAESEKAWATELHYMPSRKDVGELEEVQNDWVVATYLNDIIPHSTMLPRIKQSDKVWGVFFDQVQLAMNGKDPKEAASEAAAQMKAILEAE